MGVRADWHLDELALGEEPDLFAAPIEEVGERIDLLDPAASLYVRLGELLSRENNLFNGGVTCPIKDRPDTSCHACPVSKAHDKGDPLSVLCRVGREQEVVLTEMAVLACRDESPSDS